MLRKTRTMMAAAAVMFASATYAAPASSALFSPGLKPAAPFTVLVKNNGGGGKGGLSYSCEGLQCTCTGDADCNDMFTDGVCGDIASCNDDVCKCLRLKKALKTPKNLGGVKGTGAKVK